MRVLTALLAVLMLVLSCLPCADICEQPHAHKEYSQEHAEHYGEGAADYCSPFCHCTCCGTVCAVVHDAAMIRVINTTPSVPAYRFCIPGTTCDVSFSVWQPPRIA